ncbi:LamG-like jellyroll fold domain-containing protein [Stigmatella erecta]|uniref:Glycosyl hydrolases family 2 n=1 Tax=Stigmatella erecta TaxID=83460 RepID=A0A1I0KLS4_9BACT|nr:LamG-like jellyroll fold domain-containing protein [Stigmatella erecta]SEU25282.1 Glycosyl hydrolases family 2 [Stigmatella erecta]
MSRPARRFHPLLLLLLTSALIHPLSGCSNDDPDDTSPDASTPDASTPDASTPDASTPDASTPEVVHGLKGEYFRMSAPGTRDFALLGGVVLEPNIHFTDLTALFSSLTGRTEHTTARWTGRITAPETGDYTFYAIGDNGFRMFIDNTPVIDHWVGDWDVEQQSAPVRLVAGETHEFRMELFQDVGGANMYLRWSTATIAKQIVPATAFTPPEGFEVYPAHFTVGEDGLRVALDFPGPVTALGDLPPNLEIAADTTPMPQASAVIDANDPSVVVVTLSARVQRGQRVRVSYTGTGGLSVEGAAVPQLSREATNTSTHRLRTAWGDQLDPAHPLPEYPRPQQVRERWSNLNGPWEFSGAAANEQPVPGKALSGRIIVPFPPESLLSGVERHEDHMFYRKLFTVPADWQIGAGQRLLLHFGAVDYRARVWVNGQQVAEHTGGYTAFSADITSALSGTGEQELIVAVTDTTGANQPVGKQSPRPSGIFYTPTSGIWQTVWLEPVPTVAIDSLVLTPNLSAGTLSVTVRSSPVSAAATVTVEARTAEGQVVGTISGPANTALTLPVPQPRPWTPEDPYLYSLSATLTASPSTDTVGSYFGMRSMSIQNVGGFQKLVLNGKPVFSLSMLDQGFWPDGLYTAPSDAALRWDLQAQKDLGFNAVRKHIKVEPARWFYHADQIGLMVWQDFVSGRFPDVAGQEAFRTQGFRMMEQFHNAPSIVGWIVFNEGWGEWNREATGVLAEEVKAADPSRWVNAHSGVNCCDSKGDSGKGDVIDHHDYGNNSPPFPDARRAAMDGEHGGFTLRTPGHMWPGPPTVIYSGVADKAALTAKYVDNTRTFYLAAARAELSGSVYTQVTDLENELNGLYTYDRREIKVDPAPVKEINLAVIAAGAAAGEGLAYPGRGHWPLNEDSGTVSHDTEGTSHLTLHGNTQWAAGRLQSALRFDGNGDFAETAAPVLNTQGDYSISAWVTLDKLPGNYATAVSQDGRQTANPFYLQYGQGAFAFSTPGDRRARHVVTPQLGRWYHLVGVRAGNELRLYVDGQRVAAATATAGTVSTGPLAIGRAKYNGSNTDYWEGAIDEVQAFGRALSDSEVSALYASVPQ